MEENLLRVVSLRQGKLKPAEFRLREGERGLSLFAHRASPSPDEVVAAVRAAGKKGEFAAAAFAVKGLRTLGLRLVPTQGGTPVAEVNAIHCEARLSWFRRFYLWLLRRRT